MTKQWCYSFDDKNFANGTYDTKKACLEAARKDGHTKRQVGMSDVKHAYLAQCETPPNERMFPDADFILEYMADQAGLMAWGAENDYPDVTQQQEDDLTIQLHELLSNWCKKYGVSPSFFMVYKSIKYDLSSLKPIMTNKGAKKNED
ncbi:hypothetical protein [Vibrio porteresiae]|uniref:Uncharacterized protein n=1 Tax=Vibrio porteresiae DSM 19223 TaxID=1123496 RepID=A0ABZ0Q983_9VIBR|nr:hypothetical protein [Vibrio porteresiae]WPC72964.1 hypothetical protein R8Z52_12600 [Vibrio porteresiae DSM 19223]